MTTIYDELTRKLCNTRVQEFLPATKQNLAAKKGLASTADVNLRTTLNKSHKAFYYQAEVIHVQNYYMTV